MVHNNINVFDLEKSIEFYRKAFDLHELKRIAPEDGSFIIVYLGNENASHNLELTWIKEMVGNYGTEIIPIQTIDLTQQRNTIAIAIVSCGIRKTCMIVGLLVRNL
jgi:hypothetical protein